MIDIELKNSIVKNFKDAILTDFILNNYSFISDKQFDSTIFTSCTFINCKFSFESFNNSSFVNCRFYDCILDNKGIGYSDRFFTIFGCTCNNDLILRIFESEEVKYNGDITLEQAILSLFFKKGSFTPRHRQLSQIKNELQEYNSKAISKALHFLENNDLIQFNGDLSFLTRAGISYYNEKYRTNI